jgi:hypothetical protein
MRRNLIIHISSAQQCLSNIKRWRKKGDDRYRALVASSSTKELLANKI